MLAIRGFGEKCSMSMDTGDIAESLHVWGRTLPRLIPWIEVNNDRTGVVDSAVAGLKEWAALTDQAIVTTVPGKLSIYDELRMRLLALQIIPGLKTNDALTRFDDVDGWKRVSIQLSGIAQYVGSDTVVLENESAVGKFGLGDEILDWDLFRKAMEYLPKGLRIIWYPGITGNADEKQDLMTNLCMAVVEVHGNVTLVDRSYGRPAAVKWHWSKEARKRLDSIGAPTIPMQYFYGPDKSYWQDNQIRKALGYVADAPEVIIYPGAERFKEAAIGIGKALEAGGSS
jgi:hypothetical protein